MQCYPQAFGPQATLHNFGAKFFSVDLGTSQYLYTACLHTTMQHAAIEINVLNYVNVRQRMQCEWGLNLA